VDRNILSSGTGPPWGSQRRFRALRFHCRFCASQENHHYDDRKNKPGYCFHVFSLLCEQAFSSRLTLREAGQVEFWEWPNELSAGVILIAADDSVNIVFCWSTPKSA
jgi:hypothetical protein